MDMDIDELAIPGYERVVRARDPESGLHAIIAIHDTTLGPALGGLRMWDYATEEDGLEDVLRLARAMTYKSAVAHTGLGGGKAVIFGDPARVKSEPLYLAMGRFIDTLGGAYITAEDVNTDARDLEIIRRATRWVTGLPREKGGSGDPSPFTAYGVYLGIRAALRRVYGEESLRGRRIAVQGVGHVGSALCRRLREAGAEVLAADRKAERVQRLAEEIGVVPATEEEIFTAEVDVFAPCALGGVINDDTIDGLRCRIVAGAANNPLAHSYHGEELQRRGVLYAPDYVINAGGIISVAAELAEGGYDERAVIQRVERIPRSLEEVWDIAERRSIPPSEAADRLAEEILEQARRSRSSAGGS